MINPRGELRSSVKCLLIKDLSTGGSHHQKHTVTTDLNLAFRPLTWRVMVGIKGILESIKIPYLLVLYGILWISIQPFLITSLRILDTNRSVASQVISVLAYLAINAAWLLLWYKITKYIRNKAIG